MSLERWQRQLRERSGRADGTTFYTTEPHDIEGGAGLTVRYLVVEEGDAHGLPAGVYAETNITPDGYQADFNLRNAIRTSITLDLMDESQRAPSVRGDAPFSFDMGNATSFQQ